MFWGKITHMYSSFRAGSSKNLACIQSGNKTDTQYEYMKCDAGQTYRYNSDIHEALKQPQTTPYNALTTSMKKGSRRTHPHDKL